MIKIRRFTILLSAILIMLSPVLFADLPKQALIHPVAKYTKNANPLLKIVKQKSTVGIIPFYVIKGKIYIFLGQELTGGKKEASGTFSDFGGSAKPDGKTILHHALREFTEETMGQMKLNEEDILKNGYLLYKESDRSRKIYYIFVKFSEKQYLKTQKFHTAKVRLKASGVPNSYLEKETYLWVRLEDLLPPVIDTVAHCEQPETIGAATPIPTLPANPENTRFTAHTADGQTVSILIRGYFLRDCLQNADLSTLLQKLSK